MIVGQLEGFKILDSFGRARPAAPGSEYYLAARPDGSRVVVEMFPAQLMQDRPRLEALRASLHQIAALRHPNIVPIVGSGVHEGRPYVLMPSPAAGTLEDRWQAGMVSALDRARVTD